MLEGQILERLKTFFFQKGFAESPEQERREDILILKNGLERAAVYIFETGRMEDRNTFLTAIVSASKTLGQYSQTYLAVPKIYAAFIDARTVEEHGFGLLTYNESTVEEVLPPRHFDTPASEKVNVPLNPEILEELRRMKSRLDQLQRTVEALSSELAELKLKRSEEPDEPFLMKSPIVAEAPRVSAELPAYMKDNPWVTVLSRRGRE